MATLSRTATFWSIAAVLSLYLAASAAPTPLYVVYQGEWGFSATTLTLVFAIYVFGLLATLLVLGRLSDYVGRRPMIAASIGLEALAMLIFVVAGDVAVLALARVVQGVATGIAVTAMGAALVDLEPLESLGLAGMISGLAPIGGLAVGALLAGALVQYGPLPTHLIYILVFAGLGAAAWVALRMPESAARRAGALASLRPSLGVPARVRAEFLAVVPITVASWALGGLYLSLGPSVTAQVFSMPNHVIGGLLVALLCGTGAVTIFLLRGWRLSRALNFAAGFLAAGMALTLAGLLARSPLPAALGTVVAGVGFGASGRGSFGTVAALPRPQERGGLFAVFYVVAYLAFSVPALVAGLASTTAGLRPTAIAYGAAVLALSFLAAWAQRRLSAREVIPG